MKYHVLPHEGEFVVAQQGARGEWTATTACASEEIAQRQADSLNRAWVVECRLLEASRLEKAMQPRRAVRQFPPDLFA